MLGGFHALVLILILMNAQESPCKSTAIADLTIVPFSNKTFGTAGYLNIWLPPGYADHANISRRYPVLYMLNGQILFDDCRGGVPEWRVDETLTRLINAGTVKPLIVVGIDPGKRDHEFLPYKDSVFAPTSPEPAGKRFPDFLANEVIPFITDRYRIEKGPQAIGGGSYGAVAALYALLARPDLFTLGLLESPSLAIGNGQLIRDTQYLFKGPTRVYLGMGGSESGGNPNSEENQAYITMLRMLERNLKAIAVDPPVVLSFTQPNGTHTPATWATRFEKAIEFLFPK